MLHQAGQTTQRTHGVPHLQENAPPQDPTMSLCLGSYGDPRGWAFSFEQGAPVQRDVANNERVHTPWDPAVGHPPGHSVVPADTLITTKTVDTTDCQHLYSEFMAVGRSRFRVEGLLLKV